MRRVAAQDIAQNFLSVYTRREKFLRHRKAKSFAYTTAQPLSLIICDIPRSHKIYFTTGRSKEEQNCLHEITCQGTLRLLSFAISQLPRQTRGNYPARFGGTTIILKSQIFCIFFGNTVKSMKSTHTDGYGKYSGKGIHTTYPQIARLVKCVKLLPLSFPISPGHNRADKDRNAHKYYRTRQLLTPYKRQDYRPATAKVEKGNDR